MIRTGVVIGLYTGDLCAIANDRENFRVCHELKVRSSLGCLQVCVHRASALSTLSLIWHIENISMLWAPIDEVPLT